jgi:hypothetical protein
LAGNIVIPDNLTRAEIRLKALPAARAKAAAPLQILFLLFLLFTLTSVCSISQF